MGSIEGTKSKPSAFTVSVDSMDALDVSGLMEPLLHASCAAFSCFDGAVGIGKKAFTLDRTLYTCPFCSDKSRALARPGRLLAGAVLLGRNSGLVWADDAGATEAVSEDVEEFQY